MLGVASVEGVLAHDVPRSPTYEVETVASWTDFLKRRQVYLTQLGRPILTCVSRRDTSHPAFAGCIDWHSSVHGHYALHVLFRLTGNVAYLKAANRSLRPQPLESELRAVKSGALERELPYGYAWFLALAVERERTTGRRDLRPLATEIAQQLHAWLRSLDKAKIAQHLAASDYDNLSWALINLAEWARLVGDRSHVAELRRFVRTNAVGAVASGKCVARMEMERSGFLPPCLLRMMLAVEVLGAQDVALLARSLVTSGFRLTPLRLDEIAGHRAGLNFSRSWALWSLYVATRDFRYRSAYQSHMTALLQRPQYWAQNYAVYAHWVAQFGVYALAKTYDQP